MYRPPAFREDRPDHLHAAIRAYPLATLVTHGAGGLSANLLPFLLVTDDAGATLLQSHLARANPQLADLRAGAEALLIFRGPDAYVSPNWYPTKQENGRVVPTWNYVTVQAWGVPRVIEDQGWLRRQIVALTTQKERGQPLPWSVEDAPAGFIEGQLKGIAGVEILVDRIEGKWKASQNHPAANRAGVIAGLKADDAASPMAALMEHLEEQRD
ncbi:transcriptional regulator [Sphingomonas zeicaulis]|uniref:FMN-binding negative transcriptional regulator n=1 Tax=Sphingomonas zeicaulis TaxID=1632740 RepID=UPI003D1B8597